MTNILMVLATSFTTNGMVGEFEPTEYSRIKSIISKNVRKIYAACGLRDKDAASLYETVPALSLIHILRMQKEEKAVDLRYSARHYNMGFFIRTCRMATKRSVIRLMETF